MLEAKAPPAVIGMKGLLGILLLAFYMTPILSFPSLLFVLRLSGWKKKPSYDYILARSPSVVSSASLAKGFSLGEA